MNKGNNHPVGITTRKKQIVTLNNWNKNISLSNSSEPKES